MNYQNKNNKTKIIKALKEGKTLSEISKEIFHSTGTGSINQAIIKMGIHPEEYNEKYLYMNREWLKSALDTYGTPSKISDVFQMPRTSVTRYAQKFELYIPKYSRNAKNDFNEKYFDNIDTATKSYWLGMIIADGNIYNSNTNKNQFELKLSSKDSKHIFLFAEAINFPKEKVRSSSAKRQETDTYYTSLRVYNKYFCDSLSKYGIIPRKTGHEILPNIKPELSPDLIRGLWDGDGHIDFDRIDFATASFEMMYSMSSWLCNRSIHYSIQPVDRKKEKILFRIVISKQSWNDFINIVYYPGCYGLERKIINANNIKSTLMVNVG